LEKKKKRKSQKGAGIVAQGEGPEFKPQYHKKKKKKKPKTNKNPCQGEAQ
jgi:hypothetical protein